MGRGLAVSQARGQLVPLRQQLVHLGDKPHLIGLAGLVILAIIHPSLGTTSFAIRSPFSRDVR